MRLILLFTSRTGSKSEWFLELRQLIKRRLRDHIWTASSYEQMNFISAVSSQCKSKLLVAVFFAAMGQSAFAQEVVAVQQMPPYAVQQHDGSWSGPAVDLFRAAADRTGTDFQFVPAGTTADAAALFPTYATAQPSGSAYSTLPFHIDSVGLIGLSASGRFLERLSGLLNVGLLWAAAIFSALVLIAGLAFWVAERNGNENISPEGGKLKGMGQRF